jgi:hypothetical protein
MKNSLFVATPRDIGGVVNEQRWLRRCRDTFLGIPTPIRVGHPGPRFQWPRSVA